MCIRRETGAATFTKSKCIMEESFQGCYNKSGECFGKEQMKNKRRNWGKEVLLAVLFPRRCPICDELVILGEVICTKCEEKLPYLKEPMCKKCGKQLAIEMERREYCSDCARKAHFFRQGKGLFSYQKEMKRSMYRFKYGNRGEYAEFFARTAMERYGDWVKSREIEAVIPVPMYVGKKRLRGYNQAEVFAKCLGVELGLPVEVRLVKRVKNTTPQKELSEKQRKDNLKGAFQVRTNIVKYKKILLVDDIYTTGTTDAMSECLLERGVEEVFFLSICIGEGY